MGGEKGMSIIDEIYDKVTAERRKLIKEFLDDLHDRDNKRDCEYRCGGKPGEPCKHCTNYKHCDENNYPIIEKWEKRLKE